MVVPLNQIRLQFHAFLILLCLELAGKTLKLIYFMKKILILGIVALMLQSCATLFSGTKDQITFRSTPPNANVLLNGKEIGMTNNSIIVKRKDGKNAMITYQLDGYNDLTFKHEVKTVTGYWVNFGGYLFGIVPGIVFTFTDIATSAYCKPKYDSYEKTLEPKK